jgi:DNA-binding transcriptional MerR regulator
VKSNRDDRFGSVEAANKIGVSTERLRYWERVGIVDPQYVQCGTRRFRRYSREDISRARIVKALVDREKYTLQGAIIKIARETGDANERMVQ